MFLLPKQDTLKEWLSSRWVLFAVLVLFVALKIPHLYYPYYWDESWPYLPAITEMHKNGISLLPNAISAELSRGHPLFFHAIGAAWMQVFGNSHFSMHSFAMAISIAMVIAVYEVGYRLFNARVALMATLLLVTHEIFFVQSSFVLFEVLLPLLGLLSLYFYTTGRYLLTTLCLTLLFYTKESGLVMGAILGVDSFLRCFSKKQDAKTKTLGLASVGGAFVMIGLFFVAQKYIRGWYVFPLYTDTLLLDWHEFWYRFQMNSVRDIFHWNAHYRIYVALLALAVMAAVKNSKYRYLALFIPAYFIYHFVDKQRNFYLQPGKAYFILFIVCWLFFIVVYSGKAMFQQEKQRRFIALSGVFIISFLIFTSLAYYSTRYLLLAMIPVMLLTAAFFDLLLRQSHRIFYLPVLLLIVFTGYHSYKHTFGYGDCRLGAFEAMKVQQEMVNYLEQNNCYKQEIYVNSYLGREHLIDPATGFRNTTIKFEKVTSVMDTTVQWLAFDNLEPDENRMRHLQDTTLHLANRIAHGEVWCEIYMRRR